MYEWLQQLLDNSNFMPHGHCFLWTPVLLWMYVLADTLIVLAYYSIPVALWYFARHRADLKYKYVLLLFAAFIFACGTTHLLFIWNIWNKAYWLEGVVKLLTGLISAGVAIAIWPIIPRALSLPSRHDLEQAYEDLTRTHRELQARERSYRLLIETTIEGVWMLDAEGRTTFVNQRMAEMLGCSTGEMLGSSLFDYMDEEGRRHAEITMARRLKDVAEQYDFTFRRRNGEPLHTIVSISPIYDEQHQLTGVLGLVTDITDREEISRQLTRLTTELEIRVKQRTFDIRAREQKLSAIISASIDAIITIDVCGKITSLNPAAERMFGYTRAELLGQNVSMLMPQEHSRKHNRYLQDYLAGGAPKVIGKRRELEGRRADGKIFPIELAVSESQVDDEHIFVGVLRDISDRRNARDAIETLNKDLVNTNAKLAREVDERKRAEQETLAANKRLQSIIEDLQTYTEDIHRLNEMSDLLQACNHLNELIDVVDTYSRRFFQCTGGGLYLLEDRLLILVQHGWGDLETLPIEISVQDCWAMRHSKIHPISEAQQNLRCQHLPALFDTHFLCIPLFARSQQVGLLVLHHPHPFWVGNKAEHSNRVQLLQAFSDHAAGAISNQLLRSQLEEQSIRDPLTGLYNRRFFNDVIQRELARWRRDAHRFSLLLADIDHFKKINDEFGHDGGDLALKMVAGQLHSLVRAGDVVCRYGGEEFVLLLPDTSQEQAQVLAEKLRAAVAALKPDLGGQRRKQITLSVGVSCCPDQGTDSNQLVKAADQALYAAKESGRNRTVLAPALSENRSNEAR